MFDGTTETEIIVDPSDSSIILSEMFNIDGKLLITASQVNGSNATNLYEITGTSATVKYNSLYNPTLYNDTLYQVIGQKGSTKGFLHYIDLAAGNRVQVPNTANYNFKVLLGEWKGDFYAIIDGISSSQLWTINGTLQKKGDIGATNKLGPSGLHDEGNRMFFTSFDANGVRSIYTYDGVNINNVTPSSDGSTTLYQQSGDNAEYAYHADEDVFFVNSTTGTLYATNLYTNTTREIFDKPVELPIYKTASEGVVFVSSTNSAKGDYLYARDNGLTTLLTDSVTNAWATINLLGAEGDKVYFDGADANANPAVGRELYVYDFSAQTNSIQNLTLSIRAYPNPARDIISVDLPQIQTLSIYSLKGEELLHNKAQNSINTLSLNSGMYILKAYDGKLWYTTRFIKE